MDWLAARLLRPYFIVVAALSIASTVFLIVCARIIDQHTTRHGIVVGDYAPDLTGLCKTGVSCLPAGTATNLAQAAVLVAAFVPPLIGLILGVPLFAREREESTDAFALTQSTPRTRWLHTKLRWALAVAVIGAAAVAVTFRLAVAPYALVVQNPGYDLLRELHRNSIVFMVMQSVFITALAAVVGLATGRTLRTLVISVAAWPVALLLALIGGLLLSLLTLLLTSWSEPASQMFGTLDENETASFAALALAVGTLVTVHIGRRTLTAAGRRP
jgi:ABC-type transport system involved in multi-copper enzyme maturation permease subunit